MAVYSPSYSASPASSEVTLCEQALAGSTSTSTTRWTYKTKHMTIDLGPRLWQKASSPCYGLNGRVEGSIRLSGVPSHVQRVSVTLMARLSTSVSQQANGSVFVSKLMARTIPVYAPSMPGSSAYDAAHGFLLPIPAQINLEGGVSRLPPSSYIWEYGLNCDVSYHIKVCMLRKRRGLTYHESILIPVLYLPKSQPSMDGAPDVVAALKDEWDVERTDDKYPAITASDQFDVSVASTHVSGENVPFVVTIPKTVSGQINVVRTHISARIVRRTTLRRTRSTKADPVVEEVVSTGRIEDSGVAADGLAFFVGTVRAGAAGQEASWCIGDIVKREHVLLVSFVPPKGSALPHLRCERKIRVTTDPSGTIQRELNALGGVPTPALGLLDAAQPKIDIVPSDHRSRVFKLPCLSLPYLWPPCEDIILGLSASSGSFLYPSSLRM